MTTLAQRCKERRKLLNLSQQKLASMSGLSQVSIHLIESGTTERPRNILQLATALKCNPFWLLFGDTDEKDTASDK